MRIGITTGDINGIGPEVIIKALGESKLSKLCTPVIYGSAKILAYHKNIVKDSLITFQSIQNPKQAYSGRINVINCWEDNVNITLGKATTEGGKYAYLALDRAIKDLKDGLIDALVTAPINKHAMKLASFPYPGHTEYLTAQDENKTSLMMLCSDALRVALVTNHVPVSEIAGMVSKELILKKIQTLHKTLIEDFDIERPIIAVLGLNPHAGDDGMLGDEEEKFIRPAIIEAKKNGIVATGPHPADGFFGSAQWRKADAILAMYHDQGLIPFKALTFGTGINFTAGLSFVRTSPDHGTAYDIAGQNAADESSLLQAIYAALDISRNRKEYHDSRANALVRKEKQSAGLND